MASEPLVFTHMDKPLFFTKLTYKTYCIKTLTSTEPLIPSVKSLDCELFPELSLYYFSLPQDGNKRCTQGKDVCVMEQIEPTTSPGGIADTDAPRTGRLIINSHTKKQIRKC